MRQPFCARGWVRCVDRTAMCALALVLFGVAGCKQASAPIQPSIFTNPGEVTMVCFDSSDAARDRALADPMWDPTLPLDCCDKTIGVGEALEAKLERCGVDTTPVAHALVTQVQRGEVAAVDLEAKRVLDSDKKIPGYTFVDVGGLPTAIAVPRSLAADGDKAEQGPLWTYVAGRENNSVRAVPTCHFWVGRACGPEEQTEDGKKIFPTLADFADATERALVGEPRDMLLGPGGKGLWITLPAEGKLAYVELPTAANPHQPFPKEIAYYPLPRDFVPEPDEPKPEGDPYRFACAAGEAEDDPTPWAPDRLNMPPAERAKSTGEPRPTLLRLVDLSAAEAGQSVPSQLLFVADERKMALHVYAQAADGSVSRVASLPVGAPLRDFAVTPEVPALGPKYEALMAGGYYGSEAPTTPKRYLYAIDDRDGSLMAFQLKFEAGVPDLKPLLAPEPARDSLRRTLNHSDRLSLGGEGYVARALEVVNTGARLRSDGKSFDDAACSSDKDKGREKALSDLKRKADEKKDLWDESLSDKTASLEDQKAAEQEYVMAAEELSVLTNAGAYSLRGVFLMVATTGGQLVTLDVHDFDLQCRAQLQCAIDPDVKIGVVIQRHTPRLSGLYVPTVAVSPAAELAQNPTCPTGYIRDDDKHVCISRNPWLSQGMTLSVGYEAAITSPIVNGVFETTSEGRLKLKGPPGVDLCARGANAKDGLTVAILSPPDSEHRSGVKCRVTSFSTPPLLRVVEAHSDGLLLEPIEGEVPRETLLECYRDFVAFELRLHDQYFVSAAALGYQHTNMSAADGTCERDKLLDEHFTSHAELDKLFVNQFVAFQLRSENDLGVDAGSEEPAADAGGEPDASMDATEPLPEGEAGADEDAAAEVDAGGAEDDEPDEDERALKKEVNPTISLSSPITPVSLGIAGANSRSDTLPHRVRYFPESGYLFVVDQASQGLRRFFLTPKFEADKDSNFR